MSGSNTLVTTVIIIALFLGGLYIATSVPMFDGKTEVLEERSSGRIDSGYYLYIPILLDQGTIKFSYRMSRTVDGFIMTEEQYYGFESFSGYIGSEDAVLDAQIGTLTCDIKIRGTYYFIVHNENDRAATIVSLIIELTIKKTLLEVIF